LICGISTLIPQYFVAIHLGAELPAFAGSLVSLFAVAMVSRLRKGKPIQSGALRSAIPAKRHCCK
jgi:lactate permease